MEPFDAGLLDALLKRCHRRDWHDTGLVLDHMAERGTVALLVSERTSWSWGCAWTPAGHAVVKAVHENPHLAVRQVAEAVLVAVGAPRPAARNPPPDTAQAAFAIAQGKLL